jgi:hypothetical protein
MRSLSLFNHRIAPPAARSPHRGRGQGQGCARRGWNLVRLGTVAPSQGWRQQFGAEVSSSKVAVIGLAFVFVITREATEIIRHDQSRTTNRSRPQLAAFNIGFRAASLGLSTQRTDERATVRAEAHSLLALIGMPGAPIEELATLRLDAQPGIRSDPLAPTISPFLGPDEPNRR